MSSVTLKLKVQNTKYSKIEYQQEYEELSTACEENDEDSY